jgi:hypothetical protein
LGEPVTRPQWKNQSGATGAATILKRGPGTLQKVVVNGWSNTTVISLYDGLSAVNPIAIITPAESNDVKLPFILPYDLDFYTGLTYTTVNAATNVTFVYE